MTGTPIEMYVSLELPPTTVRDAAMYVMRAVGERDERYRDVTLKLDLNLPGHGQLAVPIEASIENRPGRWECGIQIAAAKSEKFFPTFDGTLSVTPDGRNQAELWLQGSYFPPGGAIGKGLDATLMRGVAEESLREFLSWLADEVKDRVAVTERERLDQARHYHG